MQFYMHELSRLVVVHAHSTSCSTSTSRTMLYYVAGGLYNIFICPIALKTMTYCILLHNMTCSRHIAQEFCQIPTPPNCRVSLQSLDVFFLAILYFSRFRTCRAFPRARWSPKFLIMYCVFHYQLNSPYPVLWVDFGGLIVLDVNFVLECFPYSVIMSLAQTMCEYIRVVHCKIVQLLGPLCSIVASAVGLKRNFLHSRRLCSSSRK